MNAKKTQLVQDCDFEDFADYGDYSDDQYYDEEYGNDNPQDDEVAMEKQAKKQREKAIKSKFKRVSDCLLFIEAKGVQECQIDEIESLFNGEFTRQQIKGTLESFKHDKAQTIKNLEFKVRQIKQKAKLKAKFELAIQVEQQEEDKAMAVIEDNAAIYY